MGVEVVLGMLGGLGLFLYGMKLMSDGLEKAAGAKLRKILEIFTKNKFIGMIVGILFTAVVQSSSATTVLVVSFVNASLMNLFQAAGVIMGANIGTTITGQLIALNLTAIAPLFLMGGVIMVMFLKRPGVRKIGEVVLGFGMLFVGMSTMSGAMVVLKESQEVLNIITSLSNPFLAVLTGFIVTAILQSSSATVGIVILMATQGILNLPICFFIILGCNMGSCVSALLASLGGTRDAKRAAWIHFLFNIFGSAVIFVILTIFKDGIVDLIRGIIPGSREIAEGSVNALLGKDVANTHTLFKVFQVILLFPFSNLLVKLTYKIIPGSDEAVDEEHLKFIGEHTLYSPTTAVPQAINEIERMGEIAINNLSRSMDALLNKNEELIKTVYDTEKTIDYMNSEITKYLVKVNQLSLPVDDRTALGGLFHVVNDIERIGDHAENIADFAKTKISENLHFSKNGSEEIKEMLDMTEKLLKYSLEMFSKKDNEHLQEILILEDKIDDKEKELQRNHVIRLTSNQCDAHAGMIFSDIVSNLERVADHGTNIAFSILERDPEEKVKQY